MSDCGWKGLKSLPPSPLLEVALTLMGPNWRDSKAKARGRSGAAPTALPTTHCERWSRAVLGKRWWQLELKQNSRGWTLDLSLRDKVWRINKRTMIQNNQSNLGGFESWLVFLHPAVIQNIKYNTRMNADCLPECKQARKYKTEWCFWDSLGICWILWTTTNASDRPTLTGWLTELICDTSIGIWNRRGEDQLPGQCRCVWVAGE